MRPRPSHDRVARMSPRAPPPGVSTTTAGDPAVLTLEPHGPARHDQALDAGGRVADRDDPAGAVRPRPFELHGGADA